MLLFNLGWYRGPVILPGRLRLLREAAMVLFAGSCSPEVQEVETAEPEDCAGAEVAGEFTDLEDRNGNWDAPYVYKYSETGYEERAFAAGDTFTFDWVPPGRYTLVGYQRGNVTDTGGTVDTGAGYLSCQSEGYAIEVCSAPWWVRIDITECRGYGG
ncbi:MAG: hypothetical protein ACOZNI_14400 [Myxococcota bacterium]